MNFHMLQQLAVLSLAIVFAFAAAPASAEKPLPPPAGRQVDFHKDIAPILYRSCVKCHTGEKSKGGLRMETRELLLQGGDSGAAIVPGKSGDSYLVKLVAGVYENLVMPEQGPRLKAEQVGLLRAWIDQGTKWEEGFRFGSTQFARLEPRKVELPPADAKTGLDHPIDRLLAPYFKEHGIAASETVSDRLFVRRVYLDLIGLLPPVEVVEAFEQDARPDKRNRLVKELLANDREYAVHWLTFWNDALRNNYRGTGYIDGGRRPITEWLYRSLHENKPYDQFVHELISPVPGSEGFIKGIVWRGVVNASQRPEMQAAQNVSQIFLGTNLKCASCHDSFINDWKLTDSYGLAAVFADGPLEIHRCDKPTGETAAVGFIYPQLGKIEAASKPQRMQQLADLVTDKKNGRLARTMVNRLWAWQFGRGIVEPVDDMDQPPFSSDLLDWLAADLADNGYDLRHTLELICTSRAYQSPAVGAPRPDEAEFVFRGPVVRRMTAEQFVDAVSTLTADWPRTAAAKLPQIETPSSGPAPSPEKISAQWIWKTAGAHKAADGGRIFLRKTFRLERPPKQAACAATCDNEFTLWINGKQIAHSDQWQKPVRVDLAKHLVRGSNAIAVEAINWPDRETGKGLQFSGPNPAGFLLAAKIEFTDDKPLTLGSDKSWRWKVGLQKGWEQIQFDDRDWQPAAELAAASAAPWSLANFARPLAGQTSEGVQQVRAALLNDDPLTRALGRSNREQVVTRRDTLATTLQALELTNGPTLDAKIKSGARHWNSRGFAKGGEFITAIYKTALGRAPTDDELTAASNILTSQPTEETIADLLWVVMMLPEFQLVY